MYICWYISSHLIYSPKVTIYKLIYIVATYIIVHDYWVAYFATSIYSNKINLIDIKSGLDGVTLCIKVQFYLEVIILKFWGIISIFWDEQYLLSNKNITISPVIVENVNDIVMSIIICTTKQSTLISVYILKQIFSFWDLHDEIEH